MLGITQLQSHYAQEEAPRIRVRAVYLKPKQPEKPQYKKKHDIADYQQLVQVHQLAVEPLHIQTRKTLTATSVRRNSSATHIIIKSIPIPGNIVDQHPIRHLPKATSLCNVGKDRKKMKKKPVSKKVVDKYKLYSPRINHTQDPDQPSEHSEPVQTAQPISTITTIPAQSSVSEDSISIEEELCSLPSPIEPPIRGSRPLNSIPQDWNLVQENA
jgi:hypothetical protein